jgi:hypothetical protein
MKIKHLGLGFDKVCIWHIFAPEINKSGKIEEILSYYERSHENNS